MGKQSRLSAPSTRMCGCMTANTYIVILSYMVLACLCSLGVRAACEFTVDGQPLAEGETLATVLKRSTKHTLHSVKATTVPCGGFLRTEPYYVRAGATDHRVLLAINMEHEFRFLSDMLGADTKKIVDLGANVGLASAYLAARFPQATVVAVEPNVHNFAVASMNTFRQNNVHMLWGAAWETPSVLQLAKHNRAGEWAYTMEELKSVDNVWAGTPIPGLTVAGIMQRMGWSTIDFLKVDIECGEFSLFNDDTDLNGWISKVQCLTMELHPFCNKDPKSVAKVIQAAGFVNRGKYGELDAWCRNAAATSA